MGNALSGAAREVWDMLVGAATSPGPWTYAVMLVAAVVVVALMFRGRRTMWLFLPMLGGLAYWGWRRFT